MRINFVNSGAASAIVTLSEKGNVPLAPAQKKLTPFQRMVLTKEFKRRQDEIEEEREKARSGTGGIRNSHSKAPQSPGGPIGDTQGETVEYVNEGTTNGNN